MNTMMKIGSYSTIQTEMSSNGVIRNGYNKIDFEHRIFPGVTHSLNTVDWYYDDGIALPQFRANATASFTSDGTGLLTLSGVSFSHYRLSTSWGGNGKNE